MNTRITVAVIALGFLAAAAIALRPGVQPAAESFAERARLAAHSIARSPADRAALETITELSLDLRPDDHELWRDAVSASRRLAPSLDSPNLAFVKAGFLHWYELNPEERRGVLSVVGELLGNPQLYPELWQPVLQTTRSPAFLARHAPDDGSVRRQIRDIAARWSDFSTYRRLHRRDDVAWSPPPDPAPLEEGLRATVPAAGFWKLPPLASSSVLDLEVSVEPQREAPAMIELWVDARLREARQVEDRQNISTPLLPGDQIVQIRLANPRTRNGARRHADVRFSLPQK